MVADAAHPDGCAHGDADCEADPDDPRGSLLGRPITGAPTRAYGAKADGETETDERVQSDGWSDAEGAEGLCADREERDAQRRSRGKG
jgi:hypothetical protein